MCHSYLSEDAHLKAIADSGKALDWSRAEIVAFDAPDAALRDDWRQSYDSFENGANWRALRMKRAMELQESRSRNVEAAARSAVCASKIEMTRCLVASVARSLQLEGAREAYERAAVFHEEAKVATARAIRRRSVAIEVLLGRLTLRRVAAFGPRHGQRELAFRSLKWRGVITATERIERPLWRAWNAADRRAMVVRVPQDQVSLKIATDLARGQMEATDDLRPASALRKRFIITLRQDPTLGTLLLVAERACHPLEREEVPIAPAELRAIMKAKGRPDLARLYCALGKNSLFGTETVMSMRDWRGQKHAKQDEIVCQSTNESNLVVISKNSSSDYRRTLANGSAARLKVAEEIADVLCSELHLDVFTGVLRVGRITFARRRKALVRRLYFGDRDREAEGLDGGVFTDDDRAQQIPDQPEDWAHAVVFARPCGRWWLDAWVAKRSFLRGVLVL